MARDVFTFRMKEPRFGSNLDEDAFFQWIKRIAGVDQINGIQGGIEVSIVHSKFDDSSLRELFSLYQRYDLNFAELRIFINESNEEWVNNTSAYWFDKLSKSGP